MLSMNRFKPPEWLADAIAKNIIRAAPEKRVSLGLLPTPMHRWNVPNLPKGCELYIKRDDLSGMELGGNKVRKLEFLLADAMNKECDNVVTIGGIQSNHCRATACAARLLGMDSTLILRTSATDVDKDPGFCGNLLMNRLAGANIELVTKDEYSRLGSEVMVMELCVINRKNKCLGFRQYMHTTA
eukprot:m.201712 g.201712  ORF g.201712 m.201712 type:complete len:185 (-) comp15747_c0_seq21:779-1333(-)